VQISVDDDEMRSIFAVDPYGVSREDDDDVPVGQALDVIEANRLAR